MTDPLSNVDPAARGVVKDYAGVTSVPGIEELWHVTQGDPRVCIAVLDGSADMRHPALAGANLTRVDLFGRMAEGGFAAAHGTHVTSLIFGQHQGSIRGVAPRCRGLVIPIFSGSGREVSCSQDDLALAIGEAVRRGAHIVNVSGGEPLKESGPSVALRRAIRECIDQGRLVVAAAGNEGCSSCLHVPGALPSVLAVGAMDLRGEPLPGSNWGEVYRTQGVLALGQRLLGAVPGGVQPGSGTSFATAIVSGVAGLLLSLQLRLGRRPNPFLIRQAIIKGARGCGSVVSPTCARLLAGRLDVKVATTIIIQTQGAPKMPEENETQGQIGNGGPEGAVAAPAPVIGLSMSGEAAPSSQTMRGFHSTPSRQRESLSEMVDSGAAAVTPSACGCGGGTGSRQKVFAIGELGFDFGTRTRLDSLQANAPGIPGMTNSLTDVGALLRYLLGFEKQVGDVTLRSSGNLADADFIYWVLKQGDCPLYVIRPQKPYAEAAIKQLLIFLIEQNYSSFADFQAEGIFTDCIDEFYPCFGGIQTPFAESLQEKVVDESDQAAKDIADESVALFNERIVSAAHVAIAGEVIGRVRLYAGEEVEVISPIMRGMQNWNTVRLIKELTRLPAPGETPSPVQRLIETDPTTKPKISILVLKLVASLYEAVRNPGKASCDRAKNYFATKELFTIGQTLLNPIFLSMLGALDPTTQLPSNDFLNITASGLDCKAAVCERYGSEPYDVEVGFYNFAQFQRGTAVISQTIDVSGEVPVPVGRPRTFPRRF